MECGEEGSVQPSKKNIWSEVQNKKVKNTFFVEESIQL